MYPDKGDALHPVAERLLGLERDLFKDFFIYVFEGPEPRGREEFLATLQQVEAALGAYQDGPWFLPGAEPSVVDCVFAPKVERVVAACLYWKALDLRDRAAYPNLVRWLDALDARPSFAAFKSDFYTLVTAMEPLFGHAYAVHTPEAQALRARVDGVGPTAWRLPISQEELALEPAPPGAGPSPSEAYARQAAAVRLIINHKRLPSYMLRALGRPGPEYRSVLADPLNEPDERFAPSIDAAYRYLVLALLRGHEAVEPLLRADIRAADAAYQQDRRNEGREPKAARERVVACLEYLRERISVPRDMTLPEARQLRAHLNWLADELR
jgi:glutathione S-transferase